MNAKMVITAGTSLVVLSVVVLIEGTVNSQTQQIATANNDTQTANLLQKVSSTSDTVIMLIGTSIVLMILIFIIAALKRVGEE